jgi:hypothetical protein
VWSPSSDEYPRLKCVWGWELAREWGRDGGRPNRGEASGEKALRSMDVEDGDVGLDGVRMRPGARPKEVGLSEKD